MTGVQLFSMMTDGPTVMGMFHAASCLNVLALMKLARVLGGQSLLPSGNG